MEQQLIAGIGALWLVLTTVVTGGFVFLKDLYKTERQERLDADVKHAEEVARYEARLTSSADVILRQNESMQRQLESQAQLIEQQHVMLKALQSLTQGGGL